MNRSIQFILLSTASLLLQDCNTTAKKETATETAKAPKAEYNSAADFVTVEKYDTHVHINAIDSTFINQAKNDNLRLVTVNVNSGRPVEEQRAIALKLVKPPPRVRRMSQGGTYRVIPLV